MEIMVPEEFKHLYETSAKRPIIKVPAPVLRQISKPVESNSSELQGFIETMLRSMDMANGIGLAAPQMGRSERIIVIAPSEEPPQVLINPVVTEQKGAVIGQEGCLSIPGLYGDVERAEWITVEGLDRDFNRVQFEATGLAARVVLHEVDHLEGVLFIDKVDLATLHWSHPDEIAE